VVVLQWKTVWKSVYQAMRDLPAQDIETLKAVWPVKEGLQHVIGSRTLVMGILNVTEDSFSDGGSLSECAPTANATQHLPHLH
jgi:hypothetical protein